MEATNSIKFKDIGCLKYEESWRYQEKYFNRLVDFKNNPEQYLKKPQEYIFFVEHSHVYTIGKSGSIDNLLINKDDLEGRGIEFYNTNRGGDITYHGPGQVVGYPIIDIQARNFGLKEYIFKLESAIIELLADYNLKAERLKGATGVWLDADDILKKRKICAIGVKCSRWITMHGFALNVNTDLSFFNLINPCGFKSNQVTSMELELKGKIDIEQVKVKLLEKLFRNLV